MKCERLIKCMEEILPKYTNADELREYILKATPIMGENIYHVIVRRLGSKFVEEFRECMLPEERIGRTVIVYLTGREASEINTTDDLGV